MYIINSNQNQKLENVTYWCNGVVAEYLIYKKHLPLFSRKGRRFGFAKTKALQEALDSLPFWLNIAKAL